MKATNQASARQRIDTRRDLVSKPWLESLSILVLGKSLTAKSSFDGASMDCIVKSDLKVNNERNVRSRMPVCDLIFV